MRPKIFSARSVAEAMERVRRALGDDAIILSVDADPDGGVRVTAAAEELAPESMPFGGDHGDDAASAGGADMGAELRHGLAYHGVPKALAERLVRTAVAFRSEGTLRALAGAFDAMFSFRPLLREARAKPTLLLGPPGAGKTLAVAKLASRLTRSGRPPTVIATDARRPGGVAHMEALTRMLGIELATAETPDDLQAAVTAAATAPVLIDTAGTNPFNGPQMDHLEAIVKASGADPVLVLPAGGDAMESIDIGSAFASLGAHRLLGTRLDMAQRMGGLLAAACASRMAFAEVSTGPHAGAGLATLSPAALARLILPHAATVAPADAERAHIPQKEASA
ncbi:MAG: hypothetical protein IPM60_13130 [Rhodospirillales bacterium]|nr:hypothetical protein [Rhodospirillales bacterium]